MRDAWRRRRQETYSWWKVCAWSPFPCLAHALCRRHPWTSRRESRGLCAWSLWRAWACWVGEERRGEERSRRRMRREGWVVLGRRAQVAFSSPVQVQAQPAPNKATPDGSHKRKPRRPGACYLAIILDIIPSAPIASHPPLPARSRHGRPHVLLRRRHQLPGP